MQQWRYNEGFSLYELIMTLGLAAIVVTIGLPSFGNIVSNQILMAETNTLFHSIHLARKESITRRREVTLCPTLDGENCEPQLDWSIGWMVFVNIDRDRPANRDLNEPILHRYSVNETVRIRSNRRSFSLRSTELRATNGTLKFCDRNDRGTARALVISYTGRPRTALADVHGRPIQCAH